MVTWAHNGSVRIAVEDLGGAGGGPLLLVMGLGTSRFWWPPGLVERLIAAGFQVACYDQRDSGQSSHLTEQGGGNPLASLVRRRHGYTAEDMVDDAVAVLDALGWDSAHVFGHSMGGGLAQALALRAPRRVRTIAASACIPVDAGGSRRIRYLRAGLFLRLAGKRFPATPDGDRALALTVARALAGPGYPVDEAALLATLERERAAGIIAFRDQRAQSRQAAATWHGGAVRDIAVPTLVLHGSGDPLVRPTAGRDLARTIPGAKLVVLEGAGHDLPAPLWPLVAAELRALADRWVTEVRTAD